MLLKDHLQEIYNKASLENNILVKENIVIKWVHRFGFDSLNDLLIKSPVSKEEEYEEENEEQINLRLLGTSETREETICKSDHEKKLSNNRTINKNKHSDSNRKEYLNAQKLPLPYINNFRKWINNDKKAS